MSNEMIAVRLTTEQKQKLEQLASQRNQTVSDVIRSWINGDSVMDSIPPELLERVRAEAQRRRRPESHILQAALRYAFDNLFVNPGWVRW